MYGEGRMQVMTNFLFGYIRICWLLAVFSQMPFPPGADSSRVAPK